VEKDNPRCVLSTLGSRLSKNNENKTDTCYNDYPCSKSKKEKTILREEERKKEQEQEERRSFIILYKNLQLWIEGCVDHYDPR